MGSIRCDSLGKRYKHYARPTHRLWEWALAGRPRLHAETWAVRGVSLEIRSGEAVAVIGQNGAGKSTLLKLVKGTLRPSEGEVRVEGRLAALELGLGFHPDFTGRENLHTAGALIGLDAPTIRRLTPEIEDFAEIGEYIDHPVRTYSTGMQLRLAFSLATALRPEILLIDEALAVGDAYFQQKCIQRIRQFRELGTTLVLVSHDATAIRTLCDRALLMENGLLVREGTSDLLLDYYNAVIAKRSAEEEIRQAEVVPGQPRQTRSGDRRATIESVDLRDASGSSRAVPVGARVQLVLEGRVQRAVDDLTVGFVIRDRLRNDVFGTNTHHLGIAMAPLAQGAGFRTEFRFPLNLGPGTYSLSVALHAGPIHLLGSYDWWDNVCVFQVIPGAEPRFVGTNWLPVEAWVEAGGERWGSAPGLPDGP